MRLRARWKLLPAAVLLLALVTALPAWAGGVVVGLVGEIPQPQAGEPFTVQFTIHSMHDGSPQAGWTPAVTAIHPATGETISVDAEALAEPGHYAATLTLPAAGEWNWRIVPMPDYPGEFELRPPPLQVSTAAAPATSAVRAATSGWGLALVAVLAGLGLLGAAWFSRRRLPARA